MKILHAADLDLDVAVTGVGRTPPDLTIALRDASLGAWTRLVEAAIRDAVDIVIVAGGIAPGPSISPRARVVLLGGLRTLAEAGIQSVILDDRTPDDAGGGWQATIAWPRGVHLVGPPGDATRGVMIPVGSPVTAYGVGGGDGPVAERLRAVRREDRTGLHLGLVRASIGAGPGSLPGDEVTIDDLRQSGLDYWAVGGDHHARVVSEQPWVVVSGTTQGRGFGASETGPKGATLVVAEGSTVREVRFVPLDVVRFASVVVDVASLDRLDEVGDALARATEGIAAETGRMTVARGILTGSGPVRDDLARPGALAGLVADLGTGRDGEGPNVWWDRVIDRTSPDLDMEAIRSRGDLAAEVLRLGMELRADSDELVAWAGSLTPDRSTGVPASAAAWDQSADAVAALLAEAEAIAIGELDRDDEA